MAHAATCMKPDAEQVMVLLLSSENAQMWTQARAREQILRHLGVYLGFNV